MQQENYYQIMGLSQKASEKDIKLAYRKLARKYHPDLSKEPRAEEHFKEMSVAYEVLKDPVKRAAYDQELKYKAFNQNTQHHANHSHSNQQPQESQFDSDFFESLFGHSRNQQQPIMGEL